MLRGVAFLALALLCSAKPQTFVNYSGGRSLATADPCNPSPCGPNTRCSVNNNGAGVCRCLDGYFPKPNTIAGCGPQCTRDSECIQDYLQCRGQKCVNPCQDQSPCGTNALCDVVNHRAVCKCPTGYEGSPYSRCSPPRGPFRPSGSNAVGSLHNLDGRTGPPAPPPGAGSSGSGNPCVPNPCGSNAECSPSGIRPVCSCPAGYRGNPLTGCTRGECSQDNECASNKRCTGEYYCVDACSVGVCGSGADCNVQNHRPICSCPKNYVGDPFTSCRYDPEAACNPSPCGANTNCRVQNDRAICSCIDNYIGNPLSSSGCRPECVSDGECAAHQNCQQNRCRNACTGACGEGARCETVNHRPRCTCPQFYQGNPLTRCFPECTTHQECPSNQACYQLRCTDPCAGACGINADCRVDNHKAICSCPRGYTGHPFDRCTPEPQDMCQPNPCGSNAECNPGTDNTGKPRPVCTCPRGYLGDPLSSCIRGDCETSTDCPSSQACYAYRCTNPCLSSTGASVCGTNALCDARNHKAVCYCPKEYTGEPLTECRLKPLARSNDRTSRRRFKRFLDGLFSFVKNQEEEQEVMEE